MAQDAPSNAHILLFYSKETWTKAGERGGKEIGEFVLGRVSWKGNKSWG